MSELNIKDILRSGHVIRWQIVRTVRDQTLAEHLFTVTILSIEMSNRVFTKGISDQMKLKMIDWALRHDMPEIYTGDVATPVKKRMKAVDPGFFDTIERGISKKYSDAKDSVSGTPFEVIVKLADLLDGISFLDTEGLGDHAKDVSRKLKTEYANLVETAKVRFFDLNWNESTKMLYEVTEGKDSHLEYESNGGI